MYLNGKSGKLIESLCKMLKEGKMRQIGKTLKTKVVDGHVCALCVRAYKMD